MSDTTVQKEPEDKTQSVKPTAKETSAGIPSSTGECIFNDSITVHSGKPLPQYNKGPVKAYAAVGRDKAPPKLVAYICEDSLSPRTSKALNYISILNPSIPRLVASGVIDWTPSGKEKYCYIYENIFGNSLMKDDSSSILGMKIDHVTNAVIKPIVNVLLDFRDKDITHGNIRPSNIFDGGVQNFEKVILGECLCLPASYNQPVLYETIDRAMCIPSGRAKPMMEHDLYSLGVTLAVLLRHFNPTAGMSDEEIIERKMEDGSYTTLLGRDRFNGPILELLRGLLYDDEAQRWGLDDVLVWLDGRRLSPKQAIRRAKASRPLSFNNSKYTRPEFLARDLSKNIGEAKKLIDSGDMGQWISRALEDKETTDRFEKAMLMAQESVNEIGYPDKLISRASIALYPEGPLRYKSISVHPEGIGPALSEAYILKKDIQTYVDFFQAYFITQWVDSQPKVVPDSINLVSKFDGTRAFLRQKTMGAGIEKCIYWLNPEIHCLSEKLNKFHVRSPEDLMVVYEKMSKSPSRPAYFFDRHIVAFLSIKDRQNIDPYLHELNEPEQHKRIMAEIKTLATIQKRSRMPNFPGITTWIAENIEPVYERFHDRQLRVELKKKIDRLKDLGDIGKIVFLFDDYKVYQNDNQNFKKYMRLYYQLELEKNKLDEKFKDESSIGLESGHKISAFVSAVLSGIIILATVLMGFKGSSLF